MKPWRTWLACLGMIGASAIIGGCGGGDVPDPSSDGQAAAIPEAAAPPQAPPPPVAAAPAPAPAPAPKDAGQEAKAEEPRAEVAQAEAPAPAPSPAPPPADKPAGGEKPAAPPDRGSATAEMLAMATKDQAPPPAGGDSNGAGNSPAPGGPSGGPGGPGGPGGMGGMMEQQRQMQQQQQQRMQNMQSSMQRGGMIPQGGAGGPAMGGMPGSIGGGSNQPPDFRSPEGAVQAFLDALKAKDLDRLTEATALRAQTEASPKNQPIFQRILDSTLSDSELSALAARLDGYRIAGENMAKSTGRLDVVLMKSLRNNNANSGVMGGGATYRLRITVRREKKGWGVCDIGVPTEFKNQSFSTPYRRKR